jgi:hypothetical protein
VFFVHGMDPFDFANLEGVCEYVQALGFIKTHYGQLYHTWHFEKELRRIHQEDPEARFALVGFSFGANMVRDLANAVKDDGIHIDLLVYLGGNTLEDTPPNRPEHVARIVNILAHGWIWHGASLEHAENLQYTDVWHFGSPTHPVTLEVLARELALVAQRVSVVEEVIPVPPHKAPKPHPLKAPAPPPQAAAKPHEWDFLKPQNPGLIRVGSPAPLAHDSPPAPLMGKR